LVFLSITSSDPNITRVLQQVAEKVTPSQKEASRLSSIANRVRQRLEESFDKMKVKPEIMLGGSYAKSTWLPGSGDIDFFIMYPINYPREKLENEAIVASRNAVKGYKINMRFAEHPYVEAFVDEARVNLVPCYKVERGMWRSAADRSPYHTEYIKKYFDDKLRLETRLLKKFAKSADVYGAELKVQGFSGYVCEVLTLGLGSFESVLRRFDTLKRGEVFAMETYDQDLIQSFTSAVIILDPVDSTRNLGAAISTQNVSRFILQSRRFLANPSLDFFHEKTKYDVERTKKHGPDKDLLERTVIVLFKTKERSVDILWGQLYKSLDALASKIESWGFTVLRKKASSNEKNESAFLFLLLETKISRFQQRTGPDVFRGEDLARYMEKNQTKARLSWIDSEGRVESLFERDKDSHDIFKELKRVLEDRDRLDSLGLSRAIRDEIKKFKIEDGASFVKRHIGKKKDWLESDVIALVIEEDVLSAKA
jgi:tRNA nucleotidyltransferase (CCA-adding enzyme)